jgi:hypothetical protein
MPYPEKSLCAECREAYEDATFKIFGFDTQACIGCRMDYPREYKIKTHRSGHYCSLMEDICTPCAFERKLCQFCLEPAE